MKTIIQTPTANLQDSLDFYTKLNFVVISKENPVLISDGQATIEINPTRFARAGLKMYREDWTEIKALLEKFTTVLDIENGYLLTDASGIWIYLMTGDIDIPTTEKLEKSVLGNFAGVSLEVVDMKRSFAIYEILGFKPTMGDIEKGWVVLTNEEGVSISLMKPNSCPHLFFNPSLTYFNGKNNPAIIEKVRSLGIAIAEEITHFNKDGIVDNIILRDNGGFGFFIFND